MRILGGSFGGLVNPQPSSLPFLPCRLTLGGCTPLHLGLVVNHAGMGNFDFQQ